MMKPVDLPDPLDVPDLERRFGALRRLYGDPGYARVRAGRFAIAGLGGVGSWAAEALARSGVAALTLIDLDHIAESNINRQIQAVSATIGQAKVLALRDRILAIHPACEVTCVEEFVDDGNWPGLLVHPVNVVIDACDQVRAKAAMSTWAMTTKNALVIAGAAGGKRRPQDVEVDDLSLVTHDPLLASLRQRLRKHHGAARTSRMGLRCVFSREAVLALDEAAMGSGGLNCHGYGSSVSVTATFGMVAASVAIEFCLSQ